MDVVITTIFPPTAGAAAIAHGLASRQGTLWVIGDRKGPKDYPLPQVRFVDIESQLKPSFSFGPHASRKELYTEESGLFVGHRKRSEGVG